MCIWSGLVHARNASQHEAVRRESTHSLHIALACHEVQPELRRCRWEVASARHVPFQSLAPVLPVKSFSLLLDWLEKYSQIRGRNSQALETGCAVWQNTHTVGSRS